uniref:C2H2-type domain-containing protein n=1 Tax=Panagrellus redivivus TaxID=6233 RepID=A0A7E4W3Q4_PANRE
MDMFTDSGCLAPFHPAWKHYSACFDIDSQRPRFDCRHCQVDLGEADMLQLVSHLLEHHPDKDVSDLRAVGCEYAEQKGLLMFDKTHPGWQHFDPLSNDSERLAICQRCGQCLPIRDAFKLLDHLQQWHGDVNVTEFRRALFPVGSRDCQFERLPKVEPEQGAGKTDVPVNVPAPEPVKAEPPSASPAKSPLPSKDEPVSPPKCKPPMSRSEASLPPSLPSSSIPSTPLKPDENEDEDELPTEFTRITRSPDRITPLTRVAMRLHPKWKFVKRFSTMKPESVFQEMLDVGTRPSHTYHVNGIIKRSGRCHKKRNFDCPYRSLSISGEMYGELYEYGQHDHSDAVKWVRMGDVNKASTDTPASSSTESK